MTLEVGVALRCSRIVAVIGRDPIRFLPVILTVLGWLALIDRVLGRDRPPLLASTLRDMTITATHAVRSVLAVWRWTNTRWLALLKLV